MAFDKETAARLESLYREHLEEAFQRTFRFDPITVELTQNMFDQDAFHVTVAYDGDGRPLDPAKLNRISSVMVDEAAELGIESVLIESYVDSREYGGQVADADEPHKIHRADGPVRTEFCTLSGTPVKSAHYPYRYTGIPQAEGSEILWPTCYGRFPCSCF